MVVRALVRVVALERVLHLDLAARPLARDLRLLLQLRRSEETQVDVAAVLDDLVGLGGGGDAFGAVEARTATQRKTPWGTGKK